jgi:hypothetical protein
MLGAADFINGLTDWQNLLQGGLGNLVGSALGVFGAGLVAVFTLRRQRRNDREHAREMAGVQAAEEVAAALRRLSRPVTSIRISRELSGGKPIAEARKLIEEPAEEFGDVLDRAGALLPEELMGGLRGINVLTSIMVTDEVFYELWGSLDRLQNLEKQMVGTASSLYRYRQDPFKETRRLRREARRRMRRDRRQAARTRLAGWVRWRPWRKIAAPQLEVVKAGQDTPPPTRSDGAA